MSWVSSSCTAVLASAPFGSFVVALDEVDLVGLHLVGIELEILLHAAVDLLPEFGADAGERQDDADLDLLRLSRAGRKGKRGDGRNHSLGHEQPSRFL